MFDFNNVHADVLNLTPEIILNTISEESIFRYYFPNFSIGCTFHSPFRKDNKPSFGFYSRKDIRANDFSTGENWNCFQFVMELYKIPFNEALLKIYNDLRVSSLSSGLTPQKIKYVKDEKIIKINKVNFTKQILEYWSQYDITLDDLVNNNAFNYDKYWINNKTTGITKMIPYVQDVRTAFLAYNGNNFYHKLYQPESDKYKWVNNIPIDLPFGITTLPYISDTLIITKSWKDMVFLRKYFPDVIATQNESLSAYKKVDELKYKNKILFYDNDNAGIIAVTDIKNKYDCLSIESDDIHSKDITDYRVRNGRKKTEEFIKTIKRTYSF